MTEPRYVEAALPRPFLEPLTYEVPPELRPRAAVGMRALLPLGKRLETGYITGFAAETPVASEDIRSVVDLPDSEPVFSGELVELCKWIAEYYCCGWGEALHSALPAGLHLQNQNRYSLVPERLADGPANGTQRKVAALLYGRGPMTERQIAQEAGRTGLGAALRALADNGVIHEETEAPRDRVSIRQETYVRIVEERVPDEAGLGALQRRAPKQAAVYFDLLHGEPERSQAVLFERHRINGAVIKALAEKGLVALEKRELLRGPGGQAAADGAEKHALNADQRAAHDAIAQALDAGAYRTFLLQGVTGSGKTEVYLQAIEHALAQGRSAIILVPEISLTPQTVGRFKARFQTDIAVLHSGLAQGERYDEWRRAKRGDVRIVVGARSAIFAPLANIGLIVVDEEHDSSYKQGEAPRYHGRDVAVVRAQMNNAVCVLGSATPSVESIVNVKRGKSERLLLRSRATEAALPEVALVDMRAETRETGANAILSRHLEEEVKACVARGEQAMLLLNRRGYAPFVLCPQCGWTAECGDCQVTLTYHAKGAQLACHYCNARRAVPQVCEECGFNPLLYLGAGTQKAEEYLMKAFENARVARMDADTTARKGGHAKILGRFASGEIDILIGTQMIAKGHDYPGVTVVGVLNADTGLCLPDFRAAENVFQLVTQVSGRAGRGGKPGKVVLQTYRPNHYAIQAAAHHDVEGFYQREIAEREGAAYPPFRRLANLMIESEDPEAAERAIMQLARVVHEEIEAHGFDGVERLGPAPATVRRVRKKYRWSLGLLCGKAKRLNTLVRASREAFQRQKPPGSVQLKVDLDPYGMF